MRHKGGQAEACFQITERFVDDEEAAVARQAIHQRVQGGRLPASAIRVVRIAEHDAGLAVQRLHRLDRDDSGAAATPGGGVLGIGRAEHGNLRHRPEPWQQVDQDLCAGGGGDQRRAGHPIGSRGRGLQGVQHLGLRQPGEGFRRQRRHGVRHRVDAGGQVDEGFRCAGKPAARLRDPPAMGDPGPCPIAGLRASQCRMPPASPFLR